MRYLEPALIGAFCIGSVVVFLKWLFHLPLGPIDVFNGGAAAHWLRLSPIQFMGKDVLMHASDYPHCECRFPNSVDYFLNWKLGDELRRKMFWENPVRFYGEP